MALDTRQLEEVQFGFYSPSEILELSQCEVNNTKREGHGSVYDPRMGTLDRDRCETCGETAKICTGHFGHIELNVTVVHPEYIRQVINYLRCICLNCYKFLITKDEVALYGINKLGVDVRFKEILEKVSKTDMCQFCGTKKTKISLIDDEIHQVHKVGRVTSSIPITPDEIKKAFENLSDEDVRMVGVDPSIAHPRCLVFTRLPVIPPSARPPVRKDGDFADDDLTNQYIQIVQANNKLLAADLSESKQRDLISTIVFRIATTFRNSSGVGKNVAKHPITNRAIRSISKRLSGKQGQLRENLSGKRCEQTGRSVISPDPTLEVDEIGVPVNIANTLTVCERVNKYNKGRLQELVDEGEAYYDETTQTVVDTGKVDFILSPDKKTRYNMSHQRNGQKLNYGDVIISATGERRVVLTGRELAVEGDKIERNGVLMDNVRYSNQRYELKEGEWIERKLRDGDWVEINRQPTLHRGSMLGGRARILPHKTIRMNLAITGSLNADFDGDEANLHVPQNIPSQVEMAMLCSVKGNMISAQGSKPNVAIVQDSLLSAYMMTKEYSYVEKHLFFDMCMKLEIDSNTVLDKLERVERVLAEKGCEKPLNPYHGRALISLLLPDNFSYRKENGGMESEPEVKIFQGVFYEGVINKAIVGAAHNSIIHILCKYYGADRACRFVNELHYVTNEWLLVKGFSIGMKDFMIPEEKAEDSRKIRDSLAACFVRADRVSETTKNAYIAESRISMALSDARDMGQKMARDALPPTNNLLQPILSGSKGSMFNATQVFGALGQQSVKGGRPRYDQSNGTRGLTHYPKENISSELKYESRGFVSSSFGDGLKPREMWWHATSGREGVTNTAMSTADSGYIQRQMVKVMEDMVCKQDGTIRDTTGRIFQFSYNEDGYDPVKMTKLHSNQEAVDVFRIVEELNNDFELGFSSNCD